jgi:hypothetical protein
MSLERWRRLLSQVTGAPWFKAVGLAGAAFLATGALFLVFGSPMEPPAAGSGGVAPVANGGDDGWTDVAGYTFVVLGVVLGGVWGATYALPRLSDRFR